MEFQGNLPQNLTYTHISNIAQTCFNIEKIQQDPEILPWLWEVREPVLPHPFLPSLELPIVSSESLTRTNLSQEIFNEDGKSDCQISGVTQVSQELKTDHIMRNPNRSKQLTKNTSLPKFLLRLIQKHLTIEPQNITNIKKILAQIKTLRTQENAYISVELLNKVLESDQKLPKILHKAIRRHYQKQIIENNSIVDKVNYLVYSKVYGLRCRSKVLSKRFQAR